MKLHSNQFITRDLSGCSHDGLCDIVEDIVNHLNLKIVCTTWVQDPPDYKLIKEEVEND